MTFLQLWLNLLQLRVRLVEIFGEPWFVFLMFGDICSQYFVIEYLKFCICLDSKDFNYAFFIKFLIVNGYNDFLRYRGIC